MYIPKSVEGDKLTRPKSSSLSTPPRQAATPTSGRAAAGTVRRRRASCPTNVSAGRQGHAGLLQTPARPARHSSSSRRSRGRTSSRSSRWAPGMSTAQQAAALYDNDVKSRPAARPPRLDIDAGRVIADRQLPRPLKPGMALTAGGRPTEARRERNSNAVGTLPDWFLMSRHHLQRLLRRPDLLVVLLLASPGGTCSTRRTSASRTIRVLRGTGTGHRLRNTLIYAVHHIRAQGRPRHGARRAAHRADRRAGATSARSSSSRYWSARSGSASPSPSC